MKPELAPSSGSRSQPSQKPKCPPLHDAATLMKVVFWLETDPQRFHKYVCSYASCRFSETSVQKIGLATYELVENAVRYSTSSGEPVYELLASAEAFEVRATNDAVPARITKLRDRIHSLQRNAADVFAMEMARACHGEGLASMGLARLVVEAGLTLDIREDLEGRVTVSARGFK